MEEKQRQFQEKESQDAKEFRQTMLAKLTELELKFGEDVPGALV